MTPMEAELCKLMTNAWRYIQFATVNQFYMIASAARPRLRPHPARLPAQLPAHGRHARPGLRGRARAWSRTRCSSPPSATTVRARPRGDAGQRGPAEPPGRARRRHGPTCAEATVGILGMAFKAESDDPRDSLAYKLRKLLALEARRCCAPTPTCRDPSLVPLERVLAEADVLFVATPHRRYRGIGPARPARDRRLELSRPTPCRAPSRRARAVDLSAKGARMKILVTGSAGFIAGYSSRSCSTRATRSSASTTTRSTAGSRRATRTIPRYRFVEGDAKDAELLTELRRGLRPLRRLRRA